MISSISKFSLVLFFLLLLAACERHDDRHRFSINYPEARKEPFDTTIFGVRLSDEYHWMGQQQHEKEMQDFSRAQGELAYRTLDSIPGTEVLQKEINELFTEMQNEVWNLTASGGFLYYNRDIAGEGTTLCRRKDPNGAEEKLLGRVKINGQSYGIRKTLFAYKKPLLAMMLTRSGEADPHIRIFHLDKKEFLNDSIAPIMFNDSRGVSMAWSPDDQSIFYTQSPPTSVHAEKYFRGRVKQHIIGAAKPDQDIFGFEVNAEINLSAAETPYIYSFKNSPYLLARIRSAEDDNYAYAVPYAKLNGARTPWIKLNDYINLGDGFDANNQWLYAVTPVSARHEIVKIDMTSGSSPVELVPQQEGVIAGTDLAHRKAIIAGKDVLYALVRIIGNMHILKVDLKTNKTSTIPLPGRTSIRGLQLLNSNDLLFMCISPVKVDQYQWYQHSSDSTRSLPFAADVLDKSSELRSEVIHVPSRDGKKIPVSLVYMDTVDIKQNNAWLIEGYGNSGASRDLYFDPYLYPWIKRGGVYAYAHVRGGGELGEDWFKDGQFPNKKNSINDMVDIAEWLQKNNYSSSSKIMVMGASAGSFLVGNPINQRPDLFAGGIFIVGLPDLATQTDAAGARDGNKSMGDKNTQEGFLSNYEQSAYYHIPKEKELPAMLIIHGATDYILSMSPAARYAAKLQQEQKGDRPMLFLVNWEGGHATANEDEPIHILKFALWQTGHPDFQMKTNHN